MKSRAWFGIALGLAALLVGGMLAARNSASAQQSKATRAEQSKKPAAKPETPAKGTSSPAAADEAAIRASVAAFEKAYNAHDAKALAALFVPEGQMIDETDFTVQGRDAIERVFTEVFADERDSKIEVTIESLRLIGTALAIETGSTKTTRAEGETPDYSRYTVVHMKSPDGKWLVGLARDTDGDKPGSHERLQQLSWLIGDWVNERPESLVKSSYRWSDDQNYILGEFTLHIAGRPAMSGTQRIAWDPVAKQVRSWVFESTGGFAEAAWSRIADQWTLKARGVTSGGDVVSATNIFNRTSNDRFSITSRDRMIGGEVIPDVEEIMVVRIPPKPQAK
ncbi:MAG: YybH family protein [Planctomycetaceae bacterium]